MRLRSGFPGSSRGSCLPCITDKAQITLKAKGVRHVQRETDVPAIPSTSWAQDTCAEMAGVCATQDTDS